MASHNIHSNNPSGYYAGRSDQQQQQQQTTSSNALTPFYANRDGSTAANQNQTQQVYGNYSVASNAATGHAYPASLDASGGGINRSNPAPSTFGATAQNAPVSASFDPYASKATNPGVTYATDNSWSQQYPTAPPPPPPPPPQYASANPGYAAIAPPTSFAPAAPPAALGAPGTYYPSSSSPMPGAAPSYVGNVPPVNPAPTAYNASDTRNSYSHEKPAPFVSNVRPVETQAVATPFDPWTNNPSVVPVATAQAAPASHADPPYPPAMITTSAEGAAAATPVPPTAVVSQPLRDEHNYQHEYRHQDQPYQSYQARNDRPISHADWKLHESSSSKKVRRRDRRRGRMVAGAASGMVVGTLALGPVGFVLGAPIGAAVARRVSKAGEKRKDKKVQEELNERRMLY